MEVNPGYKQTEVGIIPEEWEVKTLNNLSTISRLAGAEYTSLWEETPNGEIIALRGFNIGQGKIIERDFVRISNRLSLKLKRSRLCRGDVVYPCVGSIGNAVVIAEDAKYHIQQNIARITPNPAAIDSDYLANYLMSSLAEREVERFTSSSSQPSVLVGSLRQYRVPLPSNLPEQHAIAEALSDVDGLLGGLDRLIVKKRDLKQAVMQQLLTGQTRLPGFHGEWEVKTLGDIVEKIVGGGTPSRANAAFWGNEIPWVTVKDFATFNPRHSQESITRLGLRNSASHLIPAGTLITSTRMALGKAVVYELDVTINQDLKALFLKPEVSVVYLTYWFEHFGSLIDELGSGSTVKGISLIELRRFPFQAPPHPEQTAIASVLSEMDAELAVLEQRREKTRALKQAMMQELLTGRTRLL
jgi:type I restriction enzyme, S subunit